MGRRTAIAAFLLGLLWAPPAGAQGGRVPGEIFMDCAHCPELVVIQAGSFVMGADGQEKHEAPAHQVTIAKPFAIGRHEITFDDYALCVRERGCAEIPDDHAWGKERRPVINLEFGEIEIYLKWLSKKTGHAYRLPTEAEWEYAARGGTTTQYWWGDAIGEHNANCRECGTQWSGKMSAPVGSLRPNPFGLHDTAGNVWEYVQDCWIPNHVNAPADGSARLNGDCRERVTRGGSWYYFSKLSRSAYRYKNDARVKSYNIGFRVLRELP